MNKSWVQNAGFWVMRIFNYAIVAVIGYILLDIIWNGLPAISWKFLTQMPQRAGAAGGILPAIIGTFYLILGTLLLALPLGIAAAIYLSEYAKQDRFARSVRLAIVTLAGVPSIVFGLFGLGLFVLFLKLGTSILAGNLTLACMILPTIIVASEESLRAVPQGFREGSLALGATKWQTIYKNVLPYSIPGMLTGSILGVGRVAGETAPILLTAAAFFLPHLPRSVFEPCMALPYHLYILATQHPDVNLVRPMQYGTAFVLIALVLGLNLGAILLRIYSGRNTNGEPGMLIQLPTLGSPRQAGEKPKVEGKTMEDNRMEMKIQVRRLNFFYGSSQALFGIDLDIPDKQVTALIGPSGCGKSTFLRSLNRMNDIIDNVKVEGEILIDGENINRRETDVVALRKRVGMVFQKSNPFPKSLFENVAFGPRIHGQGKTKQLEEIVEKSLRRAALWEEVKDRLEESAMQLSGGQQQRLCIARALAVDPEILLMDEPASALDPRSTAKVEDLIGELRKDYTIVIVTHNMQQAARVSDLTGFFYEGKLIEFNPTTKIFTKPDNAQTEDYITGRFG